MTKILRHVLGAVGTVTAALAVAGAVAASPAGAAPPPAGHAGVAGESASAAPRCTTGRLAVTAGHEDGAAGTRYLPLRFTNVWSRACAISGYPRVVYLATPAGPQVNDPATHESTGTPARLVLQPGDTAVAVLAMPQAYNYDEAVCRPVPVAGLRVAPPGGGTGVFIGYATNACSANGVATARVRALEPQ